jgi:glycogen synthase
MKIAVVAFTNVVGDSRVLRTVRALAGAGHEVALLGYGAAPQGVPARFETLGQSPGAAAHAVTVLAGYAPAAVAPAITQFLGTLRPLHRRALALLHRIRPDAVHANDWPVLPVASAFKRGTGARIVYDSHEFAREEHAERRLWRMLYRSHVCATEGAGIRFADRIVTVGPGIARLLAETYPLQTAPEVVMNVPEFETAPVRHAGESLQLLYHGLMKPGRGLETVIDAALQVRRQLRLVLRGNGKASYVEHLRRRASSRPDRIVFEPAVPADRVVSAAAASDIGLFVPPLDTAQARHMLPNKLFEYLMAGLMPIFSAGEDVSAVLREHRCGLVLDDVSAGALADLLDRLAVEEIERHRTKARAASRILCWEREQEKLVAIYGGLAVGAA